MAEEKIVIRGAREHNLKNIDVTLPRNKLVVISGLSGSGKSSLAFDTLFAEGQRRYMESLSSYARHECSDVRITLERKDVVESKRRTLHAERGMTENGIQRMQRFCYHQACRHKVAAVG